MTTTLDRLDKVEERVKSLQDFVVRPHPMLSDLELRFNALEQSFIALGRTVASVSEILIEKDIISSEAVMDKIRQQTDEEQKRSIKSLQKSGHIIGVESIESDSIVVVEQQVVDLTTGSSKTISGYNVIGVKANTTPENIKQQLIGKKKGDTVEGSFSDKQHKEIITVKEIYNLKKEGSGDVQK